MIEPLHSHSCSTSPLSIHPHYPPLPTLFRAIFVLDHLRTTFYNLFDMDFLKTFTEAPASSSSSPFLTMLPLEIRREIYGYLVGSNIKREHDMKSSEVNTKESRQFMNADGES